MIKKYQIIIFILFINSVLGCDHCKVQEEKIADLEFEGHIENIENDPCWQIIDLKSQSDSLIQFNHCYCGLNDRIDIQIGDSISKKIDEQVFYNHRTKADIVIGCCNH